MSGHIVHPSDSRAKQEIGELDTSQQLQNVKRIRVVKYRYDPEFAAHHGLVNTPAIHSTKFNKTNERAHPNSQRQPQQQQQQDDAIEVIDTGVIAQEVREVLPDAVLEAGSVLLPSGEVIDNFLLVNKDRIYMENIGAVKELCKVTGSLETRIEQLERMNSRLVQVRKIGMQFKCLFYLNGKMRFFFCQRKLLNCSHFQINLTVPIQIVNSINMMLSHQSPVQIK